MSLKDNAAVIDRAFARLQQREEDRILPGLKRLLSDAMAHALEIHDQKHRMHGIISNSYGWAVFHDGRLVCMELNSGKREGDGSIGDALADMGASAGPGWVGVLMAGINPSSYFAVDYELFILHDTINLTRRQFNKYFRRIG